MEQPGGGAAVEDQDDAPADPPEVANLVSYRPDIDGVRALAIVLVVAFHAEIPGLQGGFIGVDVFFVLSGWLITRQLLLPIARDASVSLSGFWSRRIRRLVPAMSVMILSVFALSLLLLSPLEWGSIAERGLAAALYVSNILFAHSSGDYFAAPLQTSPFLHTWSLGVEEQFYLVWPLVFWAVARMCRGRNRRTARRTILGAMAAIAVVSFALCVVLTDRSPQWAFYGLPSRAWEFAAGGLAAAAWTRMDALPARWLRVVPLAGLAVIVAASLTFDRFTVFPGYAALVPVAGTLLLLVGMQCAGARGGLLHRSLTWGPVRRLGLLSYSWYLWHWPFIVLAVEWSSIDTVPVRTAAALAALPVAALSLRFVEQPVRVSPALRRSWPRTVLLGGLATVVTVVAALGVHALATRGLQQSPYEEYAYLRQSFSDTGCTTAKTPGGVDYCEGGDLDGDRTVVLVGDSHALQWMAALSEVGEQTGTRVILRQAGNCSATPLAGQRDRGTAENASCSTYQAQTQDLIDELHPDGVVLSDARSSRRNLFAEAPGAWGEAFRAQVDALRADGVAVGAIRDNPGSHDPLLCLAHGRGESFCSPKRSVALDQAEEYATAEGSDPSSGPVPTMDLDDVICGASRCPVRRDDIYVFAASSHLTKPFTLSQTDRVAALLDEVLGAPTTS